MYAAPFSVADPVAVTVLDASHSCARHLILVQDTTAEGEDASLRGKRYPGLAKVIGERSA